MLNLIAENPDFKTALGNTNDRNPIEHQPPLKMSKKTSSNDIPKWGYWTIGSFLLIIFISISVLLASKPSKKHSASSASGTQLPANTQPPMHNIKILEHTSKLPHKQSFRIILPGLVSEDDLIKLTKELTSKHRVGSELMFFNWWTADQNIQNDACWSFSKCENDVFTVRFNTDSQEQSHEAVEIRPLHVDGEIGLWYWNRGETSHFIHIIPTENGNVKIHTVFSDGSNAWSEKKLINKQPLEFLWSDDDDEDRVYFVSDGDRTELRSKDGSAIKLDKIR